jgi:peptide deformylase
MKKNLIADMNFLKTKSEQARPDEVASIIQDLEDSLDLKRGLGLSAIQIGIPKQVAIIRYGEAKIDLINAYIIEKNDKFRMTGEGCLSLPSLHIDTRRYKEIKIMNNGKEENYTGILAVCIQHELDHFSGLTILDRKWRSI